MANFLSALLSVFAPKSTGTGVAGVSTTAVGLAAYSGLASAVLAKVAPLVAVFAPGAAPQVGSIVAAVTAFLPALGVFLTGIGVRNAVVNSLAGSAPVAK